MEGNERPEGVPATEIIVLHDAESEKSLAIVFFENEDDYRTGGSPQCDAGNQTRRDAERPSRNTTSRHV